MSPDSIILKIPLYDRVDCPACRCPISAIADVEVTPDLIRENGSPGFNLVNYHVVVKTKILKFNIEHSCNPRIEK